VKLLVLLILLLLPDADNEGWPHRQIVPCFFLTHVSDGADTTCASWTCWHSPTRVLGFKNTIRHFTLFARFWLKISRPHVPITNSRTVWLFPVRKKRQMNHMRDFIPRLFSGENSATSLGDVGQRVALLGNER
jgi:hypothetical protein